MNFRSENISITDDEFGLTICFSEKEEKEFLSDDKILNSPNKYILIQRSYSEEEFPDYLYIELSDFKKSGELKNYEIDFHKDKLIIKYKKEVFEVSFNINNEKYQNILDVLNGIAITNGVLRIHDI